MSWSCYFCESIYHLSENCDIYVTLRSRYSRLKNPKKLCLCYVKGRCYCKIICKVCLQQHHVALCPKIDPRHRNRSKSDVFEFEKLEYQVIQRFFVLCSPAARINLQLSCKKIFNIKVETDIKFCSSIYPPSITNTQKSTIIFNGHGSFSDKNIRFIAAENKNYLFNLRSFTVSNQFITKRDLQLLAYGDPESVQFYQCIYEEGIEFKDILDSFPYASDFMITQQEYFYLPKTWLKDLLSARRCVSYKSFLIIIPEDYLNAFCVDELVELFDANENLTLFIDIKSNRPYYELNNLLTEKFKHARFIACANNKAEKMIFILKMDIKKGNGIILIENSERRKKNC